MNSLTLKIYCDFCEIEASLLRRAVQGALGIAEQPDSNYGQGKNRNDNSLFRGFVSSRPENPAKL